MGLADEDGYPRTGYLDFEDNRLDEGTGTLRVRAVFTNEDGLLKPGLFVRVRLEVGKPHRAVLVSERALGTDQGQKFVYVVGKDGKAYYRSVEVGSLHDPDGKGPLREVRPPTRKQRPLGKAKEKDLLGVQAGDLVIISGLQRVRDKVKVKAVKVQMPRGSDPPRLPAKEEAVGTASGK